MVLLEAQQEQYIKEMHKEKKDIFDEKKASEQLNNENKMEIRQEINELNDNNNYNEDKNKINNIKELSNIKKGKNKERESKIYNIELLNEVYELSMKLNKEMIKFKLQQKDKVINHYYLENFNLRTLNKLLYASFKEIKEVFSFFDKILNEKKIILIKTTDKNIIILNYKTNSFESNITVKKIDIPDIIDIDIEDEKLNEIREENENNKIENLQREKCGCYIL